MDFTAMLPTSRHRAFVDSSSDTDVALGGGLLSERGPEGRASGMRIPRSRGRPSTLGSSLIRA